VDSEVSRDERSKRALFGRGIGALVAAQANWSGIPELPNDERETIEQWAEQAKVNLSKPSVKARSRLLEVANNALMSVALGSTTPKQSRDKLGSLGLLSPSLYEVQLQGPLKTGLAERGLSRNQIKHTVSEPDAYQHLSPPQDFQLGAELISVFVRVLNRDEVVQFASPQWSLVIGKRDGSKFLAFDGYRIDGRNIALTGETPLHLFKAFCQTFGCELLLGQKPIGKFLVYERVFGNGQIEAQAQPKHRIIFSVMAKNWGAGFDLAYGYAIDLTDYKRAMSA
jgi:hypothetical protein